MRWSTGRVSIFKCGLGGDQSDGMGVLYLLCILVFHIQSYSFN